ncbi:hypothetical protein [Plantactinospora sp. GCM10030261]|uniref:hypothetical protein n=1 Tax=Plantactinospora sp. GCM10030261 TaxID=3273420 RepID=UPI00361F2AB9
MSRKVLLAGANPYVTLFDGDRPTAYASMWRVDWSRWGSGAVVVLWEAGRLRILADAEPLASVVESSFVRHFDEARELPGWGAPVPVEVVAIQVRVDPDGGAVANAGDVTVELSEVRDARPFATADFPLGGRSHGLAMLMLPCAAATVRVGGRLLPGAPRTSVTEDGRFVSSAVATIHESWCGPA